MPTTNLQHPYGFSKLIIENLSNTYNSSFSSPSIYRVKGQMDCVKWNFIYLTIENLGF